MVAVASLLRIVSVLLLGSKKDEIDKYQQNQEYKLENILHDFSFLIWGIIYIITPNQGKEC